MEFTIKVHHHFGGLLHLLMDYGTYQIDIQAGMGNFYDGIVDSYSHAVRPIVCIPTSVFDSNYTLENQ